MSSYVLSFRGRSDRKISADEEAAWGQWFQEIGSTVVDFGHRVGRVSVVGQGGAQVAGDAGDTGEEVLRGYVVIRADDLDAAAATAKGCPGLQHGARVEVGEAIEM